jgi:hypothetical protein
MQPRPFFVQAPDGQGVESAFLFIINGMREKEIYKKTLDRKPTVVIEYKDLREGGELSSITPVERGGI